ncbi:hypothetical protein GCM10009801_42100 [Streptomyces albiaxialis]|uniref:Uncharacterized protein n=1 Tax=Streptomyces albiaxialis TaxID=329523 RepID=A0ABN2W317_9ACTN
MTSPAPSGPPLAYDLEGRRSAWGALWRCVVLLAVGCAAISAGAWIDSKIIIAVDPDELAALPSLLAALGFGAAAVLWLRARDGFLVPVVLGAALAGIGGSHVIHAGLLDGTRVDPDVLREVSPANVLTAAGLVVTLVGVVWAAVSGHRTPRKPGTSIGAGTRPEESAG